jgi:hypothetical protein
VSGRPAGRTGRGRRQSLGRRLAPLPAPQPPPRPTPQSLTRPLPSRRPASDFWTTKCTNCPAALDKLDSLQVSSSHQNVQIISICCDSCDGAREIIERGAEPRWANLRHYFTPLEWKEKAKAYFGFAQVPFYVVVNPDGATVHSKGNASKVDLAAVPGAVRPPALIEDPAADKENEVEVAPIVEKLAISEPEAPRAFIMDEDF